MAERPAPESIGSYALDSQIVIRVVGEPEPDCPPEFAYAIELPGFVTPEEVAGTIYHGDPNTPPPLFTLDTMHRHTNWGASGATVEYLLNVAVNVHAEVIVAGIYLLARRVMERSGLPPDPLDRETALLFARRGIARNYLEAPVRDISLIGEERDSEANEFTFKFDGSSGYVYSATVRQAPGMPSVIRVSRNMERT